MKNTLAIAATLSIAQAQSSGWQNQQPSVAQLTQESYRCGCPTPGAKVAGCQGAVPVQKSATGCGCQPEGCNPRPNAQAIAPTKVLALQCHDVTTWQTETVPETVQRTRKNKIAKSRPGSKRTVTYKQVKAIRYRQKMVEVDDMKWETKQVKKTTFKTVQTQVRVVAPPKTRIDCCGRNVPAVTQSPCSCAGPTQYTTRTISKQVPVISMVSERVQVPCKVKKMINEPYEVMVNQPVYGSKATSETYYVFEDEAYTETVDVTKRIPIVVRQCTDAQGRMIQNDNIEQVPLHHSGPAPETLEQQQMQGSQLSVGSTTTQQTSGQVISAPQSTAGMFSVASSSTVGQGSGYASSSTVGQGSGWSAGSSTVGQGSGYAAQSTVGQGSGWTAQSTVGQGSGYAASSTVGQGSGWSAGSSTVGQGSGWSAGSSTVGQGSGWSAGSSTVGQGSIAQSTVGQGSFAQSTSAQAVRSPGMSDWVVATTVNAPVDRNLGNGMGLVQVDVVNPRANIKDPCSGSPEDISSNCAQLRSMSGQWGGQYLVEQDAEVEETSDDE